MRTYTTRKLPAVGGPLARRLRPLTPDEWRQRCIELAQEHNLVGSASFSGASVRGIELFSVPSRSERGVWHVVRYDPHAETLSCTCTAGGFGRPCGHAGAAVEYLKMRARVLSDERRRAAGMTRAAWMRKQHEYETCGGAQLSAHLERDCPFAG